MKAGADMKIAGKTVCVFVLLTITKVTRTVGLLALVLVGDFNFPDRLEIQHSRERPVPEIPGMCGRELPDAAGNNRVTVTATVGSSCVLTCSPKTNATMVTWKIMPKVGGHCALGYRADQNKTDRTNCSDRINWKFRPDRDPTLEIRQVEIAHEGDYICELVKTEGNFHKTYHLTVLAPPRLTLYCDDHGVPVCQAAAGKPPAQISWVLESTSTPREEAHDNGTVTVLSKFTAHSTNRTNTTCIVSHPAGNQSKSIACRPPGNESVNPHVYIIPCFLSIITSMTLIYCFKLHSNRLCHKTKPPETAPTHSPQDDTAEVEPYTTYVQKENIIYNSVSDLTAGQNLPQRLSPAT